METRPPSRRRREGGREGGRDAERVCAYLAGGGVRDVLRRREGEKEGWKEGHGNREKKSIVCVMRG